VYQLWKKVGRLSWRCAHLLAAGKGGRVRCGSVFEAKMPLAGSGLRYEEEEIGGGVELSADSAAS